MQRARWLHVSAAGLLMSLQLGCAVMQAPRPNFVAAAPALLAQGGLIQVVDATGYLSYQTPTSEDLRHYNFIKRVRGEVCQNDLQLPLRLEGSHGDAAQSSLQLLDLALGNASVATGVADAMAQAPKGAVLYDLTLDLHQISFLGPLFRRQCLVVSGSLAMPSRPFYKEQNRAAVHDGVDHWEPREGSRPTVHEPGKHTPKKSQPFELPLTPIVRPPAHKEPVKTRSHQHKTESQKHRKHKARHRRAKMGHPRR